MWENAYLSTKNPKSSRALKQAKDPGHKLLTSLHRQLSASELGPPLTKSWIRTCFDPTVETWQLFNMQWWIQDGGGASTPGFRAKTYYLARFLLKTA